MEGDRSSVGYGELSVGNRKTGENDHGRNHVSHEAKIIITAHCTRNAEQSEIHVDIVVITFDGLRF